MISKNYYLQITARVVIISLTALAMAFTWLTYPIYFSIVPMVFLIAQVVLLISYLNQTNRKIAYLFESIKNEDFTIRFSEDTNPKSLKRLHKSLNQVNKLIRDTHIKNRTQENYYQEILTQAEIGILTVNKNGHILFANPTAKQLFNSNQLNHIRQLEKVDEKLFDLFSELKPFERKLFRLTNERGGKQIALKTTAITLDQKEVLLVVAQDIHLELDEKETDSWIRLIRVLTHEIMNTLTPITSISGSILKYYKTDDGMLSVKELTEKLIQSTTKGLEVIKGQSENLMDFVESYRSFLRLPPPDKALVSSQKLLDRVKVLMTQENENNDVAIETKSHPDDLEFFIDESQISQVLINLCKNALQSLAGQKKGVIKISAEISAEGKKSIEVWDNGPGITPDLLDEVFVPFFTTKNTGTGIGLSLSKQILRLHGGTIVVHSVPNKETSFVLNF